MILFMLAARLIRLVEDHAKSLTYEAVEDILTNERTTSIRTVPRGELEPLIAALYQNLGNWLGDPRDDKIREEYESWGRTRSWQKIPFSEVGLRIRADQKTPTAVYPRTRACEFLRGPCYT
jgi:hypothetical protein